MSTIFCDCFNKEIRVGDVLASGQRRGSHGGIRVGIVTGFTARSVLADMVDGNWNGWDHTKRHDTSWKLRKGHFNAGYNCVITGLTEADLRVLPGVASGQSEQ
jgi:hypothetical protein